MEQESCAKLAMSNNVLNDILQSAKTSSGPRDASQAATSVIQLSCSVEAANSRHANGDVTHEKAAVNSIFERLRHEAAEFEAERSLVTNTQTGSAHDYFTMHTDDGLSRYLPQGSAAVNDFVGDLDSAHEWADFIGFEDSSEDHRWADGSIATYSHAQAGRTTTLWSPHDAVTAASNASDISATNSSEQAGTRQSRMASRSGDWFDPLITRAADHPLTDVQANIAEHMLDQDASASDILRYLRSDGDSLKFDKTTSGNSPGNSETSGIPSDVVTAVDYFEQELFLDDEEPEQRHVSVPGHDGDGDMLNGEVVVAGTTNVTRMETGATTHATRRQSRKKLTDEQNAERIRERWCKASRTYRMRKMGVRADVEASVARRKHDARKVLPAEPVMKHVRGCWRKSSAAYRERKLASYASLEQRAEVMEASNRLLSSNITRLNSEKAYLEAILSYGRSSSATSSATDRKGELCAPTQQPPTALTDRDNINAFTDRHGGSVRPCGRNWDALKKPIFDAMRKRFEEAEASRITLMAAYEDLEEAVKRLRTRFLDEKKTFFDLPTTTQR